MRLSISAVVLLCCLLPTATLAELPLDELVLYMSFDDIQGDKVMDGSEHGNHGTIMKASVAKGKGKYGNAMEFKGGDNHVLIKNAESLSISDEVSISVWVNWNDAPGDGWLTMLANGTQGGPWENYGLFVNRGSRYFYFTLSVGAVAVMNSGNGSTEPEKWTHCVCTYDGKDAKIYVDGDLRNTVGHGGKLEARDQDLRLGHRFGSGHWYNGLLDEIAVFSVALDEDQVTEASFNIEEALNVQARGKLATLWGNMKMER